MKLWNSWVTLYGTVILYFSKHSDGLRTEALRQGDSVVRSVKLGS